MNHKVFQSQIILFLFLCSSLPPSHTQVGNEWFATKTNEKFKQNTKIYKKKNSFVHLEYLT